MDWFFSFLDHLQKTIVWQMVFSHFQWVDWFTLIFLLIGFFYGIRKGLMRELAEILEVVIVMFLAMKYAGPMENFIRDAVAFIPKDYAPGVAFILTTAGIGFLVLFIDRYLSKWFQAKAAGALRVVGGALLGLAHAMLFWSLMSHAILLLPLPKLKPIYESGKSYTGAAVKEIVPKVYNTVNGVLAAWQKK